MRLAVVLQRLCELLDALWRWNRRHRADLRVRGTEREQRRLEVGHRPVGDGAEIGLGEDEHVGHFHDPSLEELEHVA